MSSADTAWPSLRVWRDLNQDGISQSNELQTLAQAGITRVDSVSAAIAALPDAAGMGNLRSLRQARHNHQWGARA
jgi:hypothetical protein